MASGLKSRQRNRTLLMIDFLKLLAILCISFLCGCECMQPSTFDQFANFDRIPIPSVTTGGNYDKVIEARVNVGPYRVFPGDVLELMLPAVLLWDVSQSYEPSKEMVSRLIRINEAGTIILPVVGSIEVSGETLGEIEAHIAEVYFNEVARERPQVFARINEYHTTKVCVVGAINRPGVYRLRHDQMSLAHLLMEAGGISEGGASVIRIAHQPKSESTSRRKGDAHKSYRLTQISERLSETDYNGHVEGNLQARTSASNQWVPSELSMKFQPSSVGNTEGRLIVGWSGTIIADESLDVSSFRQRQELATRLESQYQALSKGMLNGQLAQLPQMIITPDPTGMLAYDSDPYEVRNLFGEEIGDKLSKEGFLNSGLLAATPVKDVEELPHMNDQVMVLPVKGLNIPFKDVALREGDHVTVEPLVMPNFTVIGLVNNQGNFEYPPGTSYNLMEVIGIAGGLDRTTDPRYAMIYRMNQDGTIVHTCYDISQPYHENKQIPSPMSVIVRAGDIVDIANTPRTRTNALLQQLFRVTIGVYVPLWDANSD